MKLTDYLAAWGAVVATAVAAWNIYKDFLRRERMKLHAGFGQNLYGQDVFHFTIVNLTSHSMKVTRCGGFSSRVFHWPWMRRLFSRLRAIPPLVTIFSVDPLVDTLPFVVAPWDHADILFKVDQGLPPLEDLFVESADGRVWFCSRFAIRAIHRDKDYQRLRASKIY